MKHHDPAAIRRAKIIRTIVMVVLCLISLLPFYLMFVNGTRTSNEVKSGISFWFGSNLLENLHNFDLKQRGLGVTALGSMVNSLLVTVPATALSVYFSALTAYGIHAYDFKLRKAAWGFILAVMMVPTQVFAIGYPDDTSTTVTMYIMRLHSTDTGRAAAVSILLFLVTVAVSMLLFFFMKERQPRKKHFQAGGDAQ